MKGKLLFLDIDGTLTEPGRNIPPASALEAIKKAQQNGHKVFLCTGRNLAMLKPLLAYDFDGYVASAGGSQTNRMNAGVDAIADLCELYSFSAEWILTGQGSMLKIGPLKGRSKPAIAIASLPDFPMNSEGVCKMFIEIMRDKDMRFSEQAEEIGRLKAKIEELERNRGVDVGDAKNSGIANAG